MSERDERSDVPMATGYRMPAEWEPQERTWMAFPAPGYSLGVTESEADEARGAWAAVANAIIRFQPVTVVVDPVEARKARALLDSRVDLVQAPLNDAWMRDIGPTFVHDPTGAVAAVDWVFNGWGAATWARWDKDEVVARLVADLAKVEVIDSPMVNEGGGIHVDGVGTVMVTETVQLGERRNETWAKSDVEAELARTIGATTVVWLPRGLTRDYDLFGTRGHIDILATFTAPGEVLVHMQNNPEHPDYEVTRVAAEHLAQHFNVTEIAAPQTLRDEEGWLDWSYVNHVVINGAVIACSFDDAHDEAALATLASAYPGREIVAVDARAIFARGGGIHCITQQQPAPRPSEAP